MESSNPSSWSRFRSGLAAMISRDCDIYLRLGTNRGNNREDHAIRDLDRIAALCQCAFVVVVFPEVSHLVGVVLVVGIGIGQRNDLFVRDLVFGDGFPATVYEYSYCFVLVTHSD